MTTPPKTMAEIQDDVLCAFKAGWDARDKLDNESLKIAVEALECVFKNSNANRGDWHRCRESLAEIRKLRGEK